jgi:hypothetical protein
MVCIQLGVEGRYEALAINLIARYTSKTANSDPRSVETVAGILA